MGKNYSHLTLEQRYQIEALEKAGVPVKEQARIIGVHRSTIYRELGRFRYSHRNSDWTETERYSPEKADSIYRQHLMEKGRELKIGKDIGFANYIENKIINERYSPAAALMAAENEGFKTVISVSTLYSYIDNEVFFSVTNKMLPVKRNKKVRKNGKHQKRAARGTSIEKRPEKINKRDEFGHWEMDSVVGKQGVSKKAFLVFTERKTREEIVFLLRNHTAKEVVRVLNRIEKVIGTESFRKIFRSITVDNGSEFSDFGGMERCRRSKEKRTDVYYCHPYSSCERGSNENGNKLIRRHIPKGRVFDDMTGSEVRAVQDWINLYPRKLLDKRCSSELFAGELEHLDIKDEKLKVVRRFFLPRASPSCCRIN